MPAERKIQSTEFDDLTDFSKEQMDAVTANDNALDAKGLKNIQEIRRDLAEEMTKAKMEGVLNEKDFSDLERKIQRSSSDKKAINQVANEVKSVISENKKLIDKFVEKLTGEENIDKKIVLEDHIQLFKNFSLQEKKDYLNEVKKSRDTLKSKLAWVEELYQTVSTLAPEEIEAFRRMNNSEKKKFTDNLVKKDKNAKRYEKLINDQGSLFSKSSKAEWIASFKDLKNADEQDKWIREFPDQIKNKKTIAEKFKTFPSEVRGRFENDFNKARSNERQIVLQNMMRAMEEKHLGHLNGDPNAKYFAEADRKESITWWKTYAEKFRDAKSPEAMQESMKVLSSMLESLPDHLKKAREVSEKYEAITPVILKLDVQQKLGFNNFYDLDFEKKTKAVEEGEKIKSATEQLTSEYKEKLDDALKNKYISAKNHAEFLKEFVNDRSHQEKIQWNDRFESGELTKRKKITEQFQEEVPKELQKAHQDFYDLSYNERTERLAKLLGMDADEIKDESDEKTESSEKSQQIEHMSTQAMRLERECANEQNQDTKKEKLGRAIQMYGKILELDPTDEMAESNYDRLISKFTKTFPNEGIPAMDDQDETELTANDMDAALQKAANGSTAQDKRKRFTIVKDLNDLAEKSERLNANSPDATKKEHRFTNEFDRELNRQVAENTDDKKILDRKGKSQDVVNVDAQKITTENTTEIFKLQGVVTKHRGEKSTKADQITMKNRDTGQIQTAQTAKKQVDKLEARLQIEAAERAVQTLNANGIKLTKDQRKILDQRAANTNMEVVLQQTG